MAKYMSSNIREEIKMYVNKNGDVSLEWQGSCRDKVSNTFRLAYFAMIVRHDDCTWTAQKGLVMTTGKGIRLPQLQTTG